MKKTFISLLLLFVSLGAQAQTNMVGRVYHNANIMAGKMKELTKDIDKKFDEMKADAIKEAEEKKKRKLTAKETAEVEEKALRQDGRGHALQAHPNQVNDNVNDNDKKSPYVHTQGLSFGSNFNLKLT